MSTHTPAPWKQTRVGLSFAIGPAATDDERFDIARVHPCTYHPAGLDAANAECLANASLIAAAPDLYEALERIADAMDTASAVRGRMTGQEARALECAHAALRKADGE